MKTNFKAGCEHGKSIPYNGQIDHLSDDIRQIVRMLIKDAKNDIEHGKFEIRARKSSGFIKDGVIAWFTNDVVMEKDEELIHTPQYMVEGDYYYCGRIAI